MEIKDPVRVKHARGSIYGQVLLSPTALMMVLALLHKDAVSNYTGLVKVTATNDGCLVEWSSTFESENDNEVVEFCDPICMALLGALKETLS